MADVESFLKIFASRHGNKRFSIEADDDVSIIVEKIRKGVDNKVVQDDALIRRICKVPAFIKDADHL